MADVGLRITGMAETQAVLQAYADAAKENASTKGYAVTARAPYAAGVEEGRRKNGRIARKAGGLHFMRRAVDLVAHMSLAAALGGRLPDSPSALRGVRLKLANLVAKTARKFVDPFPYSPTTKRPSGGLAASIQVTGGDQGEVLSTTLVPAQGRTRATVRQSTGVQHTGRPV